MPTQLIVFVVVATIAQFVIGALWYSAFFGKQWSKIMGFDKLPAEEQATLEKSMTPFYGLQLLLIVLSNVALGVLIMGLRGLYPVTNLLFAIFVGLVIPYQIQGIIWANTPKKYWIEQIFIDLSHSAMNFLVIYVASMYLLG
jgi:Protein of unknown function (DUF1761)